MTIVPYRGPRATYSTHNLFILTLIKRAIVAFLNSTCIAFSTVTVAIMGVVAALNSGQFNLFLQHRLKSLEEIHSLQRRQQSYSGWRVWAEREALSLHWEGWWTATCSSVMAISSCQVTSISQSWRVPCGLAPGKLAVIGAPPHSFPGAVNILRGKVKKKKCCCKQKLKWNLCKVPCVGLPHRFSSEGEHSCLSNTFRTGCSASVSHWCGTWRVMAKMSGQMKTA